MELLRVLDVVPLVWNYDTILWRHLFMCVRFLDASRVKLAESSVAVGIEFLQIANMPA